MKSIIDQMQSNQRLDRWLKRLYPLTPQGHIQRLLRKGDIKVNGKKSEANYRLQEHDVVTHPEFSIPETDPKETKTSKLNLRNFIIYEDDDLYVLDKPQGIAVQGGTNISDSIADALPQLGKEARLVHRLDKDTSGILLIARHLKASQFYAECFKSKKTTKLYWAICCHAPKKDDGIIDLKLLKDTNSKYEKIIVSEEGKESQSRYKVLAKGRSYSLLELEPLTGRTHQLRVHSAEYGFPIYGDGKYGGKEAQEKLGTTRPTLHLHARALFIHAPSGQKLRFVAPLPKHMLETLDLLGFKDVPQTELHTKPKRI